MHSSIPGRDDIDVTIALSVNLTNFHFLTCARSPRFRRLLNSLTLLNPE